MLSSICYVYDENDLIFIVVLDCSAGAWFTLLYNILHLERFGMLPYDAIPFGTVLDHVTDSVN